MKIHPNKASALEAIKEYRAALDELIERTGVHEECDDQHSGTYMTVRFYGADGNRVYRYSE